MFWVSQISLQAKATFLWGTLFYFYLFFARECKGFARYTVYFISTVYFIFIIEIDSNFKKIITKK